MSWVNLIQFVDENKLNWAKRSTEHLLFKENGKVKKNRH
jgi:hypothetical protein